MELQTGAPAPALTLPASNDRTVQLELGRWMVLYFYPKADTSGCTKQAEAFQVALPAFEALGVALCGVSPDPLVAVQKFADKYALTFPLAADADKTVVQAYGVWAEKSMYGRKYMGVERTTFLIDPAGQIVFIWNKVKVPGHADAVLEKVRALAAPKDDAKA